MILVDFDAFRGCGLRMMLESLVLLFLSRDWMFLIRISQMCTVYSPSPAVSYVACVCVCVNVRKCFFTLGSHLPFLSFEPCVRESVRHGQYGARPTVTFLTKRH